MQKNQKNNQEIMVEGKGKISEEELEKLKKDPNKRVKKLTEGNYKVLERLHG